MKKASWEKIIWKWFHDQDIHIHSDRVLPLIKVVSQQISLAKKEMGKALKMKRKKIPTRKEYKEMIERASLIRASKEMATVGVNIGFNQAIEKFNKKIDNYLDQVRLGLERKK